VKKIAIIACCYNQEKNIEQLHQRVTTTMGTLTYEYELIYIDNASTDNSYNVLQKLIAQDQHVKAIIMSRNFGSNQPSILAGFRFAQADGIIIISGALQDPPEMIPQFIQQWEQGFDVIYGIAKKRKDNGIIRRIGYKCFYRIFKQLSYLDIPLDSGDFSLLDKKVVNVLKHLPEKDLYIRGLRTWAGFKQTGIAYTRENRATGKSSNSFFANFMWAKKAIVNFSYKPLVYISRLATGAVFFTMSAAGIFLYWHFRYGAPRGFSTLLMTMFIFGTIQLIALATIGEYLIKIFEEVKGRPPYVIREILQQELLQKNSTPAAFYEAATITTILPKSEQLFKKELL
jgi:dolichol-phosphate mannosyltransferase